MTIGAPRCIDVGVRCLCFAERWMRGGRHAVLNHERAWHSLWSFPARAAPGRTEDFQAGCAKRIDDTAASGASGPTTVEAISDLREIDELVDRP